MEAIADVMNQDSRQSSLSSTFQKRDRWLYACEHCGQQVEPTTYEGPGGTWYARGECGCPGAIEARDRVTQERDRHAQEEREREFRVRQERYGLTRALAAQTFETFDRSIQPEAYDVALSFFDCPRTLLFAGRTNGLGKTHLMAAIANRCVWEGKPVRFGTLIEFLAQIRATYNEGAEITTDRYLEQLTRSYLLCIDDLGKEKLSPWASEQLFFIINARYNLRPEGYMILTSNAEGPGLAATMGVHNWSRLQEIGTVVYMKGTDYRLRGKK